MSQLIAGVCYISIDGQRLLLKGSATATASNMTREPVMANGGVAGHKETPVAPTFPDNLSSTETSRLKNFKTRLT